MIRALSRTLGSSTRSLMERPVRTLLTMLGIIIGVAAVYVMLSIGEGSKKEILESIDSVEARTISYYPDWSGGRASNRRPWRPFNEQDVADLRNLPGVEAATGSLSREYVVVSETSDWSVGVEGVDMDWMSIKDATVEKGRFIDNADISGSTAVAVLGQSAVQSLFRNSYPIGQTVRIQRIPFTVVGVIDNIEGNSWRGQDVNNFVLVPRSTARKRLMGDNNLVRNQVQGIQVVGDDQGTLDRIKSDADYILRRSRRLSASEAPDFRVFDFSANRQAFAKTQRQLSLLLATMGSVALIVGGVGVMNIMLVSVTERTREIGLRMALGARRADILVQFLTEALILCSLAGLIGLGIGFGLSQFGADFGEFEMPFVPRIALLAFGSALLTGVVFGFLPARRASRLSPVEALRHE